MTNTSMVSFYKDAKDMAYKGFMYLPKGTNSSSEGVKFFDALFYGVPVAVENGLKVVDMATWEKFISGFSDKEIHDLAFEKVLFKGVAFKKFLFACGFKDVIFECCTFENDFLNCRFQSCTFNKGVFGKAGIRMCRVDKCTFMECDLSHSTIDCDMDGCLFTNCTFSQANIYSSLIMLSSFVRCDFSYAYLRRDNFYKTKMSSPNFLAATINGTRFDASEITDANYESISITMGGATSEEIDNLKSHVLRAFTPVLTM